MLTALADGTATIENFASSADCASTLACLRQLGVNIERDGSRVRVEGVGLRGLRRPDEPLDCGNSGTTMRLLAGILAGHGFSAELTGDASLCKRPMKRVIEPLELMGARVGSLDGKPPLTVTGGGLNDIDYVTPVASAQIKSCVLLAGLNAEGATSVFEAAPTRDHTERMLEWLGAGVQRQTVDAGVRVSVDGGSRLSARDIRVPGDLSSAAFFIVAAALLPGSEIRLPGVGVNPTRSSLLEVLRSLGISIASENTREESNEPVADLLINSTVHTASAQSSEPFVVAGSIIPNIIDELPILAILGTGLPHGLIVRDAKELRVKETDRIRAVVENLRRMGATVDEFEDGFRIYPSQLKGAQIESFGDHRIAMAFGVAGLVAEGDTQIPEADCAAVSYPEFFDTLKQVIY